MRLRHIASVLIGILSIYSHADDTEIYLGTPDRIKPNVIFILDTSGSMAICTGANSALRDSSGNLLPHQQTRCTNNSRSDRASLVRLAASNVIRDINGINLSLMRFDDSRLFAEGGFIVYPLSDMDIDDNKETALSILSGYRANRGLSSNNNVTRMGVGGNGTPLVEALHEAALYLRGDNLVYGNLTNRRTNHDTLRWYATSNTNISYETRVVGPSVSDSSIVNNDRYISPIVDECQKNHIVLFTDGESTVDTSSDAWVRDRYRSLPDIPPNNTQGLSRNCSTSGGDSCLEELAYYLYNSDHSGLPGTQRIHTHTIGGFVGGNVLSILDNAASHGGGIYAAADDIEELEIALTKIFDDIVQSANTFSAPAVAVNAFNSLEQLDQLYYSVFKPSDNVGWSGNVKRFRLSSDGIIVDSKGNAAVDTTTGFFSKNAQSYWTLNDDAPDGDNVEKGGMASRLTMNRNVYTNIAGNDLVTEKNRVHETNTALTRTHMDTNLTGENYTKLVKWARGVLVDSNGNDIPRRSMEDPLHSRPVLLNYGRVKIDGKDVPDSTLFIGTNSGYLHAFDTHEKQPRERFAFIPKELLPVVTRYYERSGTKQYGLDGPISVWHDDKNRNQIIDNREQAILYIGMRRGGSSYYALDVSDRDQPRLLWQINGRNPLAGNTTTTGFERLGQTWSRMIPATINWTDGKDRKVLFFGGGYDPKEDDYLMRTNHEQGNAIFMVDAQTGQLLWRATDTSDNADLRHPSMTSSFASDLVVVDDNGDGLANILYAADVGGRIWRLDINHESTTANDFIKGGVLADLGTNNSRANNVRFYNKPDVIYTEYGTIWEVDNKGNKTEVGKRGRYQIAIGSGYRAHPLNNEADDHFYVINDYHTNGAPESYKTLQKADLADYERYNQATIDKKMNGLFYKLPNTGEKVLSNAVTLRDTIYFSTYSPVDAANRSGCDADTGVARTYTIKPVNNPEDLERVIESKTLSQSGIVSEPVLIRSNPDPEKPDEEAKEGLLIGAELILLDDDTPPVKRTYWREQEL